MNGIDAPRIRSAERIVDTPIGSLLLVARDGRLALVRWLGALKRERAGASIRRDAASAGLAAAEGVPTADAVVLAAAAEQLDGYFAGRLRAFDLPLVQGGTAFQRQVWAALRDVPYGATLSYAAIAGRIGRPRAARAVGHALAGNPLAVVVPCHRVVGAAGRLTGYAGGVDVKAALLALEARSCGG